MFYKRLFDKNFDKNFKNIYDEYHNKLYFFLKSKGFTDYEAKELIQETFIKLFKYADKINPNIKFSTQFFQIAKSVYVSYLRKKKIEFFKLNDNIINSISDVDYEPKFNENIYSKLNVAINKLPDKCKQIFNLKYYDNWSYIKIANHLFISIKTVENQLNKALKKIKNEIINNKLLF